MNILVRSANESTVNSLSKHTQTKRKDSSLKYKTHMWYVINVIVVDVVVQLFNVQTDKGVMNSYHHLLMFQFNRDDNSIKTMFRWLRSMFQSIEQTHFKKTFAYVSCECIRHKHRFLAQITGIKIESIFEKWRSTTEPFNDWTIMRCWLVVEFKIFDHSFWFLLYVHSAQYKIQNILLNRRLKAVYIGSRLYKYTIIHWIVGLFALSLFCSPSFPNT